MHRSPASGFTRALSVHVEGGESVRHCQAADGRLHWINPERGFSASSQIPKVHIGILRPLFPNIQRLEGLLSGSLAVTGTVGKPMLDGHLVISDGRLEISPNAPLISNVNGALISARRGPPSKSLRAKSARGLLSARRGFARKALEAVLRALLLRKQD